MIHIVKTDKEEIVLLSEEHLKRLPVFQELFLEMLVQEGICYNINLDEVRAGYVVMTKDRILVEFHLQDKYIPYCPEIIEKTISGLKIKKIYCQSFDSLLLSSCMLQSLDYKLIGHLFRDIIEVPSYTNKQLQVKWATEEDYCFLLEQKDGLYETPEELRTFIRRRSVLMFYDPLNQLTGCGYLIKIHESFDYYDIGMWVNPDFRKQGIATAIISWLKEWCLRNDYLPICGCDIRNVASRKTLEKNGFVSQYKLIEFTVPDHQI